MNSLAHTRELLSVWSAFKTDDPSAIPADYKVTPLKVGEHVTVQDFGNEGSRRQRIFPLKLKARASWVG